MVREILLASFFLVGKLDDVDEDRLMVMMTMVDVLTTSMTMIMLFFMKIT